MLITYFIHESKKISFQHAVNIKLWMRYFTFFWITNLWNLEESLHIIAQLGSDATLSVIRVKNVILPKQGNFNAKNGPRFNFSFSTEIKF